MSNKDSLEALRLLGNDLNIKIITILRRNPTSPRDLSRHLRKKESDIVRRLKKLEKFKLVQSSWGKRLDQTVKLYSLMTEAISIKILYDGLDIKFNHRIVKNKTFPRLKIKHVTLDSEYPVEKGTSFVGRLKDLMLLHDNSISVFTIVGISGIGKTSLVRKFVELHHQQENVMTFWHTFKEIDTLAYLIGRIALFHAATKNDELINYLDSSKITPTHESDTVNIVTKAILRITKAQFVFDDYHKVRDEKITYFMKYLLEALQKQSKSLKIFIISRTKLPFFLDKIHSREILLSGLSYSDASKMISKIGFDLDESGRKDLYRKFGGHPMALKIYCSIVKEHKANSPSKSSPVEDLIAYFRTEILEVLKEDELKILMALCVFRCPVKIDAFKRKHGEISRRNLNYILHGLEKKMILGRTGNGEFFLHDILKEVFYSLLAYPEEMHTYAAQYHLSEGTAENIIESFYHLVKCRNITLIVKMLKEEVLYEKYRLIEHGFAAPLLEILKLVKTLGISSDMMIYVYSMEGKALSMLEKWDDAKHLLEESLKLACSVPNELVAASVRRLLGESLYLRGDFESAEKNLLEVVTVLQKYADTGMLLKNTYMKLARLNFAIGKPDESNKYSDMAHVINSK